MKVYLVPHNAVGRDGYVAEDFLVPVAVQHAGDVVARHCDCLHYFEAGDVAKHFVVVTFYTVDNETAEQVGFPVGGIYDVGLYYYAVALRKCFLGSQDNH